MLSCAIVGLPNVGKSTLFNALTKKQIPAENYPFCTIDPNVGIVTVKDERIEKLSLLSHSQKQVFASVSFVDIAGLVKGASLGEGLGNQFLANIRETAAIVQVVRCFENDDVIHVSGKVDPLHDIEVINLELILSDLQMGENILARLEKQMRGKKELELTYLTIKKITNHLGDSAPVRSLILTPEEHESIQNYPFLTSKKVLYATNVSEQDLPSMENEYTEKVRAFAAKEGSEVIPVCAKLEEEVAQLSDADAKDFLASMGLKESGLDRLIKGGYHLLNLITFITTGEIETRAWTISKGMTAQEAAGVIHTDLSKGFIRAEVVPYPDFIRLGSRAKAKEAGVARSEGKGYIVQDGDVILFFHNA